MSTPDAIALAAPTDAGLSPRLRALRLAAGLSLSQLARMTGLTKGYLSKVERGAAQPSIGSICRIAEALQLPPGRLLAAGEARGAGAADLARASGARARAAPEPAEKAQLALRPLFPDSGARLAAMEMWPPLAARPAAASSAHAGEEFLHVLSGRMEITFSDERFTLGPGDSLRFDARRPHRTRSLGAERAHVLLVLALD